MCLMPNTLRLGETESHNLVPTTRRKNDEGENLFTLPGRARRFACRERGSCRESAEVESLNSGKVIPGILPFSEAVRVGDLLLLSGQTGLVPGSKKLVDGGMKAEAKQVMENIKTSLEANGYAMSDVVKCT
jgi:enamine deaminase RidA (YjgF/YER057c/UK114 family)